MIDSCEIPTFTPRLIRWDRIVKSIDLAAGGGVIVFPVLPQRQVAVVRSVTISGNGNPGGVAAMYRNDETVPDNFIHWQALSGGTPGNDNYSREEYWYYGLEHLRLVIAGASTTRATATLYQWTYLNEYSRPRPPAPELEPRSPQVEIPDGGESDL